MTRPAFKRAQLPSLTECRDCHEPIRFVRMQDTGKALPVNPIPNPDGPVAAHIAGGRLVGFVISRDRLAGPFDPHRFTPHYATCDARKSNKPNPPTAPDPALF